MKIKTTLIVMGMLLPRLSVKAQKIKPLSIGDTLPDLVLHNVINYKDSIIRLSDFKGKLVILDFWATWCGSCISQFSKMEDLSKQYNGSLKFILVNSSSTGDSRCSIQKFADARKKRTGLDISLPMVFNDSILLRLFPHVLLPHYIWLDNDLRVVNITSFGELTTSSIGKYLLNEGANTKAKGNGVHLLPSNDTLYSCQVSTYQRIHPPDRLLRTRAGRLCGIKLYNKSLPDLFRIAYSDQTSISSILRPNRMVVPKDIRGQFMEISYRDSLVMGSYCYSLTVPPRATNDIYRTMRDDLSRVFGLGIKKVKRKTLCLVYGNSSKSRPCGTTGVSEMDLEPDTRLKYMKSLPVSDALRLLDLYCAVPIIAEGKTGGCVSLSLPYDLSSPDSLCAAFANAGHTLRKVYRLIDMVEVVKQNL